MLIESNKLQRNTSSFKCVYGDRKGVGHSIENKTLFRELFLNPSTSFTYKRGLYLFETKGVNKLIISLFVYWYYTCMWHEPQPKWSV